MPRFLSHSLSPVATVISRINIAENGKKNAGCGSGGGGAGPRSSEDPSRLRQSIPHVRTSPRSNPRRRGSRERSAGSFDEGLLVSGLVLCTTWRPPIRIVRPCPRQNSGVRELVLENVSAWSPSTVETSVLDVRTNFNGDFAGCRPALENEEKKRSAALPENFASTLAPLIPLNLNSRRARRISR